ncbi:MAG: ROK family protein [Bacteroidales bacterium]|jgi:glucokinase|nr:ROK family protein [Bacteroidales bacterium]
MELVLAIDIGGTNTAFSLVNRVGEQVFNYSFKTAKYIDIQELADDVFVYVKGYAKDMARISAIGIGGPAADYFSGTLNNPANLNFAGIIPIVKIFEEKFSLPAVLDNDANTAALGEMYFGGAKGMKNFLVITIGTGLGSGIVCEERLLRGHNGFAGEIGHTIVETDGRECKCGRKGCLERYVSANGICQNYGENVEITAYGIMKAAQEGDAKAVEAYRKTGKYLGFALANAVAFFDPEAIFLFGGPVKAGKVLLEPTIHSFNNNLLWLFKDKIKIGISQLLDKNSAILGAAALAFEKIDNKT